MNARNKKRTLQESKQMKLFEPTRVLSAQVGGSSKNCNPDFDFEKAEHERNEQKFFERNFTKDLKKLQKH